MIRRALLIAGIASPALASAQQPGPIFGGVGLGLGAVGTASGHLPLTGDQQLAPVAAGEVMYAVNHEVGLGFDADYWRRSVVNALFGAVATRVHIGDNPVFVTGGIGFGSADFGTGSHINHSALQLGAGYDFHVAEKMSVTLMANWYNAVGAATGDAVGDYHLLDAGVHLTWW